MKKAILLGLAAGLMFAADTTVKVSDAELKDIQLAQKDSQIAALQEQALESQYSTIKAQIKQQQETSAKKLSTVIEAAKKAHSLPDTAVFNPNTGEFSVAAKTEVKK